MMRIRRFSARSYRDHTSRHADPPGLFPRVQTLLIGGCAIIAVIVLGGTLLYARMFTIEFIDITATGGIDEQSVRSYAFEQMDTARFVLFPQKNIFFFSTAELSHTIAKRFAVDMIQITKRLPHTIHVRIEGKPFRILALRDNRVLDLARDGSVSIDLTEDHSFRQSSVIYARTLSGALSPDAVVPPKEDPDAPIVRGNGEGLTAEALTFITQLFAMVSERGYHPLYFTLYHESPTLEMKTREGWRVLFSLLEDAEKQRDNTQIILDTYFKDSRAALDYIDVRFDNRVFYK